MLRALALVAMFTTAARADEPQITLAFQPMYLAATMIDASLEVSPCPHVGFALDAGLGAPLFGATMYDYGVQANYYPLRDFTGLHVGAEVRRLSMSIAWATDEQDQHSENLVGAYLGWKWVASYGLTAVLQLGVGWMSGDQMPAQVIPAGNLLVGWSF